MEVESFTVESCPGQRNVVSRNMDMIEKNFISNFRFRLTAILIYGLIGLNFLVLFYQETGLKMLLYFSRQK
jgi:hypothetical protein